MPPSKPFAEIGSLKVKTVGTGSNRVKVVLLPGHEYTHEYFLPTNLEHLQMVTDRTSIVQHRKVPAYFFVKVRRFSSRKGVHRGEVVKTLEPTSEAKLARFISTIAPKGVVIEQPLAVHLKPNGEHRVFYRAEEIELDFDPFASFTSNAQATLFKEFISRLEKRHIRPNDIMDNLFYRSKSLHVIDLEHWAVPETLRKRLGLKYYDVRIK